MEHGGTSQAVMAVVQQPAAGGGLLVLVATTSRLCVLTGGSTLEAVFACFPEGPGARACQCWCFLVFLGVS